MKVLRLLIEECLCSLQVFVDTYLDNMNLHPHFRILTLYLYMFCPKLLLPDAYSPSPMATVNTHGLYHTVQAGFKGILGGELILSYKPQVETNLNMSSLAISRDIVSAQFAKVD